MTNLPEMPDGQIDLDAMVKADLARINERRAKQQESPPVLPREYPRGVERAADQICVRILGSAAIVRRATVKEAGYRGEANQGTAVECFLDTGEKVYVG